MGAHSEGAQDQKRRRAQTISIGILVKKNVHGEAHTRKSKTSASLIGVKDSRERLESENGEGNGSVKGRGKRHPFRSRFSEQQWSGTPKKEGTHGTHFGWLEFHITCTWRGALCLSFFGS